MKLNSDVTKISTKEPSINSAKNQSDLKKQENVRTDRARENSAIRIDDPRFNRAQKVLDEVTVVDKAKVRELKEKIRNGEYNVEPDKIADKLLRESIMENRYIDKQS